jgi:hypothetical protein
MSHSIKIEVECHAGYKGEERPRAIRFASQTVTVKEIVDQWIGPDHRYFKLIGDDHATYIIRHDTVNWSWELTFYQAVL